MQNDDVSLTNILKIWRAYTWRAAAGALVLSFAAGFVLGFIGALAKLDQAVITPAAGVVGVVIGVIWSVFALRLTLRKFRDFRIVLVPHGDAAL